MLPSRCVRRVPFVLELSDLWPESIVAVGAMKRSLALRLLEQAELWMYRRAVRIVTLTNAFKANLVQRGIRAAKIGVVLNGVDVDRYAPQERNRELAKRLDLTDEHFVLGYIGTLGMAHGMRNVLCAAAMDEDPNTRYLLVGPGAERSNLLAEAQRMMLRNVVIVPAQPKETIPSYWSLCDVALVHLKDLPLFETVIPSKIFEAMGMGLPILLAAPQGEASKLWRRTMPAFGCGPKGLASYSKHCACLRTTLHYDCGWLSGVVPPRRITAVKGKPATCFLSCRMQQKRGRQ